MLIRRREADGTQKNTKTGEKPVFFYFTKEMKKQKSNRQKRSRSKWSSSKQGSKRRPGRGGGAKKSGMTRAQVEALTALTWKIGEPLCTAEAMELIHVECRSEPRGRVLRLFIDKPGGVKLDDCMNISRQVGDLIDVHSDYEGAYQLEVSSPGPDRPVSKPVDFNRFKGQQARIRTDSAVNGKRKLTGVLEGIVDDIVMLRMEDTSVAIPFSQITHARLIGYQGES